MYFFSYCTKVNKGCVFLFILYDDKFYVYDNLTRLKNAQTADNTVFLSLSVRVLPKDIVT